jgi:hypothetical protein
MMGCLEIKIFLNIDFLIMRLRDDGWQVHEINHESPIKPKVGLTGEFMEELPTEDFFDLSRSDGNGIYHVVIPLTLIIFALSSYYKIDFIINAINKGFHRDDANNNSQRSLVINFVQERAILI